MKILLDDKGVEKLVPESLPMLIHGAEGSGASMYTIALAAQWFKQKYKIVFLCGYPMAEEEFTRLVGEHDSAKFYTKEAVEQFKNEVSLPENNAAIVFVKNIELFEQDVINAIVSDLVILSGDVTKSSYADWLQKKEFVTKMLFTPLDHEKLLTLNKYEGLVISGEYRGVTKLLQ